MAKFVGNINDEIDINALIASLRQGQEKSLILRDSNGNLKEELRGQPFAEKVYAANYLDPVISGTWFYCGLDFSQDVVSKLDTIFGTVAFKCIINKISTGMTIPPQSSIVDAQRESRLVELGNIEAYHIHLGTSAVGQVMMIEKQALHKQESGNCYKWNDYTSCYSASNISYDIKHIMLYMGIRAFREFNYSYEFTYKDENVVIVLEDGTKI